MNLQNYKEYSFANYKSVEKKNVKRFSIRRRGDSNTRLGGQPFARNRNYPTDTQRVRGAIRL